MTAVKPAGRIAEFDDRAVIRLAGPDALKFIDNLVPADTGVLLSKGGGHTALLSPQGKVLYDFFITGSPEAILLETARARSSDLLKRLSLYRLRAKVDLSDATADYIVAAWWGDSALRLDDATPCRDPRFEASVVAGSSAVEAGRLLVRRPADAQHRAGPLQGPGWEKASPGDYHAARVVAGAAESELDYPLGDTFPHEANLDRTGGVSFEKGCFVGQEVVARMQHKSVIRKRVVRVTGSAELPPDRPEIVIDGGAAIGRLGTVSGRQGLALVRLDRAVEALTQGRGLAAGGVPLGVDEDAVARYRLAVAERAAAQSGGTP